MDEYEGFWLDGSGDGSAIVDSNALWEEGGDGSGVGYLFGDRYRLGHGFGDGYGDGAGGGEGDGLALGYGSGDGDGDGGSFLPFDHQEG